MASPTVKIKKEPIPTADKTQTSTTSGLNMALAFRNLKAENSSNRLPSIKLPRDLTLGGNAQKLKRVYAPNLNVVRNRNRKDEDGPTQPKVTRRERTHSPRVPKPNNLIQTKGVFSEGGAESEKKRHSYGRSSESVSADKVIAKTKLSKSHDWKLDKEEEREKLKELLDDGCSVEIENEILPLKLPFAEKPIWLPPNGQHSKLKMEEMEPSYQSIIDVLTNDKLILFQFPDALPGLGPEPVSETEPSAGPSETKETESRCTLRDINEGVLGKIQVYKSGKAKLIVGNTKFNLEVGTRPAFLQETVSVPTDKETKTGDMINLGSVEGTIIVTPDWEDLLKGK